MKPDTTECPKCSKSVVVKPNGTLAHHTGTESDPVNPYFNKRCVGAGRKP